MINLFKALIVWLMLVAIPFQGIAAASMLPCAPVQVAVAPEHCADMAMSHHADHGSKSKAVADHHDKCSTCASCFAAVMAPPVGIVRVPGEMPELAPFHFEAGHVARVDLALPERPPKAS